MARGKKVSKHRNLEFKTKEKEVEVLPAEDFVPDTQPVVVEKSEEKLNLDEIRKGTVEAREGINQNYKVLCRNLWLIQKKQLFQNWGYPTFREYASKELEFKETKALYLASIWNNLAVNQDEVVFKEVMALGWSKGKELARVVTRENLPHWLEKAKHVSVDSLIKEVRTFLKKKVPDDPQGALDLEGEVKGTPVEQEMKTISLTFNYEDYLTVSKTCDQIKTDDPHVGLAQAIAMACRDFLANCIDSGQAYALQMIQTYATRHDLEVIVRSKVTKEVLSGVEVFNDILETSVKNNSETPEEASDKIETIEDILGS